jgi:hypothetical protein
MHDMHMTDFLLFIPAEHISRFYEQPGFEDRLPKFPKHVAAKDLPKEFCTWASRQFAIPKLHLAQFTIKKERSSNIHALIFGSQNLRGLEKFLLTTWEKSDNGESNFTLDGDLPHTDQLFLFPEMGIPLKIKYFQETLEREICNKILQTNKDVFERTLKMAFLPKHARDVLSNLKARGVLVNKKLPGISYEASMQKAPVLLELA